MIVASRQVAVCYCGDTENKLHTSASKPSVYITLALDFCYADMTIHRVIVHLIRPQLIFQQCCHKVVNTDSSCGCCNFVSGLTGGGDYRIAGNISEKKIWRFAS